MPRSSRRGEIGRRTDVGRESKGAKEGERQGVLGIDTNFFRGS